MPIIQAFRQQSLRPMFDRQAITRRASAQFSNPLSVATMFMGQPMRPVMQKIPQPNVGTMLSSYARRNPGFQPNWKYLSGSGYQKGGARMINTTLPQNNRARALSYLSRFKHFNDK